MSLSQSRFHAHWEAPTLRRIVVVIGAIVACLALASVTASSAAAKEQRGFFISGEKSEVPALQPKFGAETYPSVVFGDSDTAHKWTFQNESLECPLVDYTGNISAASSSLTVAPFIHFGGCSWANGGGGLTIEWGGCEDVLHLQNQGPPYVAKFELKCPSGQTYRLMQTFGAQKCTYSFPAQTVEGVTLKNVGTGKTRGVQATLSLTGLKYTIESSMKWLLPCVKDVGTYENGTLTGSFTLEGFDTRY